MSTWHRFARTGLGVFVILHALAHAVLPLRGVLEYPPPTLASAITVFAYSLALVSLFAAGVGLLGSRVFQPHVMRCMGLGLVSSVIALSWGWDSSAWWGLALDLILVVVFGVAVSHGVIAANPQPPGERSFLPRAWSWRKPASISSLPARASVRPFRGKFETRRAARRSSTTFMDARRDMSTGGPPPPPPPGASSNSSARISMDSSGWGMTWTETSWPTRSAGARGSLC